VNLPRKPEFIAQDRKILIPEHVRRLIKYLKVEEYIRVIVQKIERACLSVEGDEFLFNKYWLLQWK
jgi:hypothetical protein